MGGYRFYVRGYDDEDFPAFGALTGATLEARLPLMLMASGRFWGWLMSHGCLALRVCVQETHRTAPWRAYINDKHPPTKHKLIGTRVGLSACAFLDYASGLQLGGLGRLFAATPQAGNGGSRRCAFVCCICWVVQTHRRSAHTTLTRHVRAIPPTQPIQPTIITTHHNNRLWSPLSSHYVHRRDYASAGLGFRAGAFPAKMRFDVSVVLLSSVSVVGRGGAKPKQTKRMFDLTWTHVIHDNTYHIPKK